MNHIGDKGSPTLRVIVGSGRKQKFCFETDEVFLIALNEGAELFRRVTSGKTVGVFSVGE